MDIFEENEKHPIKVSVRPVKFPPRKEVDASLVDFSNRDLIRDEINEFKKMKILDSHKHERFSHGNNSETC